MMKLKERTIYIKTVEEFRDFCKKNFGLEKESGFKNKWVISIDGKYFTEWRRLNAYLVRFEAADNVVKKGGDGSSHKRFLENITFNINIETNDINKVIDKYELITYLKDNCINHYIQYFSQINNLVFIFKTNGQNINVYSFNENGKEFHLSEVTNQLLVCLKDDQHFNVINIINGDLERIPTYFNAVISEKLWVICNNIILRPQKTENFGVLAPALFVTESNLSLLKKPIPEKIWDAIVNNKIDEISEYSSLNEYESLKPYFKICYRNLFDEFSENKSESYTELRNAAYKSEEFRKYILNISFLSLLIFSMYDGFYRNDLLQYAKSKDYYNKSKLSKDDFLLERQHKQSYEMYKNYERKRKEGYDIKNLFIHYDDQNSGNDNKSNISTVVVAEIFECVSIAEGLLQIVENAVYHAGGGLLSLRVYSRATKHKSEEKQKESNVNYLNGEYSEAYFNLDGVNKTNYFLEVQVSDLSDKSIPAKFTDNYDIKSPIGLNYFFKPTGDDIRAKSDFFKKSENLAFHYGLEIFTKIVESRKGIFAVCGYSEAPYSNIDDLFKISIEEENNIKNKFLNNLDTDCKNSVKSLLKTSKSVLLKQISVVVKNITKNRDCNGTTYRILLPLNHASKSVTNMLSNEITVAVDDSRINRLEIFDPFKDNATTCNDLYFNEIEGDRDSKSKEDRIKSFAGSLHKNYDEVLKVLRDKDKHDGSQSIVCVCFNFNELLNKVGLSLEDIVKGCILFAINKISEEQKQERSDFILPIAMVNMTRLQLLEISRVLGVFYSNNKIAKKIAFRHLQIYLKSVDDIDLVFAGEDIDEVRERLIKMAMANGAMSDDMVIVDQLLRGVTLND